MEKSWIYFREPAFTSSIISMVLKTSLSLLLNAALPLLWNEALSRHSMTANRCMLRYTECFLRDAGACYVIGDVFLWMLCLKIPKSVGEIFRGFLFPGFLRLLRQSFFKKTFRGFFTLGFLWVLPNRDCLKNLRDPLKSGFLGFLHKRVS